MITLSDESSQPLYMQIYEQLKAHILAGELGQGSRLTSIRALARELGVGKNTITYAYEQLCAEGYIENRARSGFFVAALDPGLVLPPAAAVLEASAEAGDEASRGGIALTHDFRYGRLSAGDFPLGQWRKITHQVLGGFEAERMADYPSAKGELGLRRRLRDYLAASRGVRCRTEQIIMGPGTQWCMSILCRLMAPGAVAMEDPGYDGVRHVFSIHGRKLIPVPVGERGLDPDTLEALDARALYITPSRQFPTGTVMPIQNRLRILEWAYRRKAIVLEDDYDSEFRYAGRPIPSIQSIDSRGCVVYLGTASKALSPALRLSYMVLPEALLARYHALYDRYASPVPWLEQKVFEIFIRDGHWERHLRRICLANSRRHAALVKAIGRCMGDDVKIWGEKAGLQLLVEFRNGLSEAEALARAAQAGVKVYPVSQYWMDPGRYGGNMVLLGFAGMAVETIPAGVEKLARAWLD